MKQKARKAVDEWTVQGTEHVAGASIDGGKPARFGKDGLIYPVTTKRQRATAGYAADPLFEGQLCIYCEKERLLYPMDWGS